MSRTAAGRSPKSRAKLTSSKAVLAMIDDAIEHGATDEAKERLAVEKRARDLVAARAADRTNLSSKSGHDPKEELRVKSEHRRREKEEQRRKDSEMEARRKADDEAAAKELAAEEERKQKNQSEEEEEKRKEDEMEALRKEEEAAAAAAKELADQEERKQNDKMKREQEAKHRVEQQMKEEEEKRLEQIRKDDAAAAEKKKAEQELRKLEEQREEEYSQKIKSNSQDEVVRVPKRSALLAMGGPLAEKLKKDMERESLATWHRNAGTRWEITENTWDGREISEMKKEMVVRCDGIEMTIAKGIEIFKDNPEKYVAVYYFCAKPTELTYVLREGTVGYRPQSQRTDGEGQWAILQHIFKRLEPFKDNILPRESRDKYIDNMTFNGKKLHSDSKLKPILPGRGMGIGDTANMAILGEYAEPSDVRQGTVGNCWLLSAIACLADYDWAVRRLFRKTIPNINQCPQDQPNMYTVTLWDLKTWKEIDVVIDERLPLRDDGSGLLLGARPSKNSKLWVPYVEKAISIHCGGYDKLVGGKCIDAWPLMTGSRNQLLIRKNPKTKKFDCSAKFDPNKNEWSDHDNSPHDYNQACWKVDWPEVGGGGNMDLTENELFKRLVAWNNHNYLLGAGTDGSSDKNSTDGIVDNHAYSIIDARANICGTGIDLLLVRNPWGEGGEIENGQFTRFGDGWTRYPAILRELNPIMEDNGLFWMTKEEFFRYFPTIYVCAFNMTRLKDDKYINDLEDVFKRRAKNKKKTKSPAPDDDDELKPIYIDTKSDPSSPYKIVVEHYNGGISYNTINKEVIDGISIVEGVQKFRADPEKYLAIHFQRVIVEGGWPAEAHQFTYVYRDGTVGMELDEPTKKGKRTILTNVLRKR